MAAPDWSGLFSKSEGFSFDSSRKP